MQRISICLWYDRQAQEALNFYVSLFPNSRITGMTRYGEGAPMPAGTPLMVTAVLDGQEITALNGGPMSTFSEAISLVVKCRDQVELDRYWNALADGGTVQQCGWLKDRYGLSWQIVPANLGELLGGPDPSAIQRVMAALFQMVKLDIAALEAARWQA